MRKNKRTRLDSPPRVISVVKHKRHKSDNHTSRSPVSGKLPRLTSKLPIPSFVDCPPCRQDDGECNDLSLNNNGTEVIFNEIPKPLPSLSSSVARKKKTGSETQVGAHDNLIAKSQIMNTCMNVPALDGVQSLDDNNSKASNGKNRASDKSNYKVRSATSTSSTNNDDRQRLANATVAKTVKALLSPALLQSITQHVAGTVSGRLHEQHAQQLNSISVQLSNLTNMVFGLSAQVQQALLPGNAQTAAIASTSRGVADIAEQKQPAVPIGVIDKEGTRAEILTLLKTRQYNAAFMTALSAATVDMVVFCCSHADLNAVLGGASTSIPSTVPFPVLDQHLLLCLMQQLGTTLLSNKNSASLMQVELRWLQEIAFSIDPTDASICKHVPGVVAQVIDNIHARLDEEEEESPLRGPLKRLRQVTRGLNMGE